MVTKFPKDKFMNNDIASSAAKGIKIGLTTDKATKIVCLTVLER